MFISLLLTGAAALWALCCVVSPFPHWPAYWVVWRAVLFSPEATIQRRERLVHARRLLWLGLTAPVWGALWWLDELLFGARFDATRIERPVFLIGQPRSGTTFLHRTLAQDLDSFRPIRHLEWRYPFAALQLVWRALGITQRLYTSDYWGATAHSAQAAAQASKLHHNTLGDYEEDGIFFEECLFMHYFIALWYPYPEVQRYVDAFEQQPAAAQERMMQLYRRTVQKMLWLGRDDDGAVAGAPLRYLSKEPEGITKVPFLLRMFPDAQFVLPTRNARSSLCSLLELVRNSTLCKSGVDVFQLPDWRRSLLEKKYRDYATQYEMFARHVPLDAQISLSFKLMSTETLSSVQMLYQFLDATVSPRYQKVLEHIEAAQKTRQKGYTITKAPRAEPPVVLSIAATPAGATASLTPNAAAQGSEEFAPFVFFCQHARRVKAQHRQRLAVLWAEQSGVPGVTLMRRGSDAASQAAAVQAAVAQLATTTTGSKPALDSAAEAAEPGAAPVAAAAAAAAALVAAPVAASVVKSFPVEAAVPASCLDVSL